MCPGGCGSCKTVCAVRKHVNKTGRLCQPVFASLLHGTRQKIAAAMYTAAGELGHVSATTTANIYAHQIAEAKAKAENVRVGIFKRNR